MQPSTISINLSDAGMPTYLVNKLSRLDIHTTDDLLKFLSVGFDVYVNSSTEDMLSLFSSRLSLLSESKGANPRFGVMSKTYLGTFIDRHKSKVCEAVFLYVCSQGLDDTHELDVGIEDILAEGDALDTDLFIPLETLFLKCLPTSNNLSVTPVEDVILGVEDELLVIFSTTSILNIESSDRDRLTLEILERSDWPSNTPIYVSPEYARAYPRIVTQLVRKAVLVLEGVG